MTTLATLQGYDTDGDGMVVELYWELNNGAAPFGCCIKVGDNWTAPQPPYLNTKKFWTFIESRNEWRCLDNLYNYDNAIREDLQVGPLEGYNDWTTYYAANGGYKVFTDIMDDSTTQFWMDPQYFIHRTIPSDEVRKWANMRVVEAVPIPEEIESSSESLGDWRASQAELGRRRGGNNTKRKATRRMSKKRRVSKHKVTKRRKTKRKNTRRRRR